jgi:DNA-binding transcriptional MerR regulator
VYTSGEFAGMFRVSKKLLRHYNEIGLLVPSKIDPTNGYAYYDQNQCDKMRLILYLRSLQLPLSQIDKFINANEEERLDELNRHLLFMRSEKRVLNRIESELLSLKERISIGKEVFEFTQNKTEFSVRVFYLEKPIYIVGRSIRVKHGSPEHFPSIESLISDFFADDVPAMIPERNLPVMRFGICAEFTPETGEFTYMMGDQTKQLISDASLPERTRNFIIPSGYYACVTFSAPDMGELTGAKLSEGYNRLFGWLGESEWENSEMGVAYEVYEDERFEVPSWPEMDIWTPVKRKE